MNLKPAAVEVKEAAISTDDQPESEEDVMDYFRKLADS
jgi:hypothetical protein